MKQYTFIGLMFIVIFACNYNNQNIYKAQYNLLPNSIKLNINDAQFLDKATIGHQLFFDTKLSINNSKSCASCHNPDLFFTDGYKKTLGTYADIQLRNTPSLLNAVFFKTLNWANPSITNFAQQMQVPLFSKAHFEMGLDINDTNKIKSIFNAPEYKKFKVLNANQNWAFIINCMSSYSSLLFSYNSKYDVFLKTNNPTVFSQNELLGKQLFFNTYNCNNCHGGVNFNQPIKDSFYYSNIGLYSLKEYEVLEDKGLAFETNNNADIGKFRIPSLRNVTETMPYGHDGSKTNLTNIINLPLHYGSNQTNKINEKDMINIISFLQTLTDTSIKQNLIFQNPSKY